MEGDGIGNYRFGYRLLCHSLVRSVRCAAKKLANFN